MSALLTAPPRWNYGQIRTISEKFLKEHNPKLLTPIPIEEIAELELSIKLNSVKDLRKEFDIDGFIHSNFKEITIDDHVFNMYEERTRFTIAHEIGHAILHRKIYEQFEIDSKEKYRKFQNIIPEKDQKWLEIQANIFAGCVLVPTKPLKKLAKEMLNNDSSIQTDYSIPYFKELPNLFKVSSAVILRRLQRENIVKEKLY